MRQRITVAAASSVMLLLAGCTVSAPEPSAAPAGCAPEDARVTWQPMFDAEPYPVGYRTVVVNESGASIQEDTELDYESSVDVEPAEFGDERWTEFLVEDVNRTGQSPVPLGNGRVTFDSASLEPDRAGDFIIGYRIQQVAVPFTIICDGITEAEGSLITASNDLGATLVECGTEPVTDDAYARELIQNC